MWGQNPLEAAQLRCKVYNGPFVYNFKDIYEILEKNNISYQITDHKDLSGFLERDLKDDNKKDDKISEIINDLSKKTLNTTIKYIDRFILNDALKPNGKKNNIFSLILLPFTLTVLVFIF